MLISAKFIQADFENVNNQLTLKCKKIIKIIIKNTVKYNKIIMKMKMKMKMGPYFVSSPLMKTHDL